MQGYSKDLYLIVKKKIKIRSLVYNFLFLYKHVWSRDAISYTDQYDRSYSNDIVGHNACSKIIGTTKIHLPPLFTFIKETYNI